jgi:hypothetical protein
MNQHTVFPINSRHRVVCPNRVVKLRRNTVWLEHDFEGSDEIEFEVSLQQFCRPYHSAGEPSSPAASSGLWPVNPYGDPPVCGGKRHARNLAFHPHFRAFSACLLAAQCTRQDADVQ